MSTALLQPKPNQLYVKSLVYIMCIFFIFVSSTKIVQSKRLCTKQLSEIKNYLVVFQQAESYFMKKNAFLMLFDCHSDDAVILQILHGSGN